ncbi:DNA polymerase alpha catalytic subunit [Hondaea fermentalgiana]|uniref:DNA polymerase n=1 Tax=Hondaea fermentalgiana TaxID=2315210 RepID=A0A2R5GLE2_9STRA|nr:DNA polymerase alpha catalytic subunit [Hondaea fermentalgiana]|eukprot:GBG31716.1 DNA polymerase alpha catalytic subunit [Hondaea fermentalgiana]
MQRPSRSHESKGARARREALDRQRRQRELGLRNADLDASSDEDEGDSEDEGAARAALRKANEDLGDFVVDDDGTGYKDYGDDDEDDVDLGDAKESASGAKTHKSARARRKDELDAQEVQGTTHKLTSMFTKMGKRANVVGPKATASAPSASEEAAERAVRGGDSLMSSIVNDLMQSTSSAKKRKKGRDKKLKRSSKKKRRHQLEEEQERLRQRDARSADEDSGPDDNMYLDRDDDDDGAEHADEAITAVQDPSHEGKAKQNVSEEEEEEEEETLVGSAGAHKSKVKKEETSGATHMEVSEEVDTVAVKKEDKPKGKAALLAAARKKPVRSAPKRVAPSTPPPAADRGVTFMSTPPAMMGKDDDGSGGWSSSKAVALGENENTASTTTGPAAAMDAQTIMDNLPEQDGRKYIDVFWLDIYENYYTMKGRLHVFGKMWCERTKQFVSCYVEVKNLDRVLYVLPRETCTDEDGTSKEVEFPDVFAEMEKVVAKVLPVDRDAGRSFKVRKTELKYAFELPGVPREATEYLEVRYPMCAEKDRLPFDIEGKTFSHIFGTHQTAVEQLLLARDLMGPCWIRIYDVECPRDRVASWCKYNFFVEEAKAIHPLKDVLVREAEEAAKARTQDEDGDSADTKVAREAIKLPPPPPLRVLSLSLKTRVDPKSHEHQIMVVSGLLRDNVDVVSETAAHGDPRLASAFTIVRGENGGAGFPAGFKDAAKSRKQISVQASERALLSFLMVQMHRHDPDMIIGHNIRNFEMDVLLSRMSKLNVGLMWSKMGRLKMSRMPGRRAGGGFYSSANLTPGRLMLDTYTTARELLLGQRSYTLQELCRTQLNVERHEVTPLQVPQYYQDKDWLLKLVQRNEKDAWLALSLMFKLEAVPLTLQLSNLGGNLWSRTLSGGRAERIEHLLLHEFSRQGYVLPDKVYADSGDGKSGAKKGSSNGNNKKGGAVSRSAMRKPKYDGGLVLDPKTGLYDKFILLLDFNSLYPSIIQEYNICYTTVERVRSGGLEDLEVAAAAVETGAGDDDMDMEEGGAADVDVDAEDPDAIPGLPDRAKFPDLAILPSLIKTLVDRRRLVKQALKSERDPSKRKQLDVRQKALKLTANSMYGCLGFKGFRFFARPVAALVTSQGRSILQNTVNIAQDKLGLDVVYGDTDSIMINTGTTNLAEVNRIGQRVKAEINKLYNLLEIEQDGVFKTMLLLKKKKYAALAIKEVKGPNGEKQIVEEKETKGLDLVRRDWCQLSKDIGHGVLDHVLSGKPYDEVVEGILKCLDDVHEQIKARSVALEKFVITKGLNKNPRDYPDVKSQPHLQVALAMIARNKPVSVGDHIPYVICTMTRQDYESKARELKEKQALKTEDGQTSGGKADDPENEEPMPRTPPPSNASYAQRAFHPEEVTNDPWKLLELDVDWYLKQQVVPPTRRLCEPIEGLSPGQIAEHLGLDPSSVQGGAQHGDAHGDEDLLNIVDMPDIDRFKACDRVTLSCESCDLEHPFLGVVALPQELAKIVPEKQQQSNAAKSGLQCPRCDEPVDLTYLTNQLHLAARRAVKKYYEGWLLADDPSADLRTRQQSVVGRSFTLHGRRLQLVPEYRPSTLYTQLRYLESLVNAPHALEQLKKHYSSGHSKVDPPKPLNAQDAEALAHVQASLAAKYLNRSAYNWVQPDLFQRAFRM